MGFYPEKVTLTSMFTKLNESVIHSKKKFQNFKKKQ